MEAGTITTPRPFRAAMPAKDGARTKADTAFDAYHGSLDAAMTLHKAMLPGWHLTLDDYRPDSVARVRLGGDISRDTGLCGDVALSRLLLLAILDALIQGAGNDAE
ncbi:MAG: hypothetical protein ACRC52_07445 [Aeromonas veronii]